MGWYRKQNVIIRHESDLPFIESLLFFSISSFSKINFCCDAQENYFKMSCR